MSSDATTGEEPVEPEICDYCGTYIVEVDQQCPALHDGRCRP
jgi:hypothetical protein